MLDYLRWAVALTAGATVVAATTSAASQGEVAMVMLRQWTPELNLVPPPSVAIDAPAADGAVPTLEVLVAAHADDIDNIDPDTECMAKVVHHEAANQPLEGQLAVAEVILNREHSGRFPTTACAVANQRGQFFQTESYHVPRTSPRWRTAVAIARVAQAGEARPVAPNMLFFHASYVRTPSGHRHEQIQIADQVFYR